MVSARFWPVVGGAERQALELSAALVAKGHRVTVLTRRLGDAPEREVHRGVTIRRLPSLGEGALDSLLFLIEAFGWLLAHGSEWDAVHAHLAGSPALAAAAAGRLFGRPTIVKLGGGRGIGELAVSARSALGRLKLTALAALRPRLLAVAADLADEARAILGPVAVEVLPNGVDCSRFTAASRERKAELRRSLGLPPDAFVFLYAGRLSWEKRLPWFLSLWLVATEGTEARVVLVGEGPERAVIEAFASPRIVLLGEREDLPDLYAAVDAFILPSESEGLSNALLEAMASGLAPLASRVGGTPEAVTDGRDGLLFARDDAKAASAACARLVREKGLAAKLGAEAARVARARFDLATVVARLEELYRGAK